MWMCVYSEWQDMTSFILNSEGWLGLFTVAMLFRVMLLDQASSD